MAMSNNVREDWLKSRNITIKLLFELAERLDNVQGCVDGAKTVSTTGTVIGGACSVYAAFFTGGLSLLGTVATVANAVSTAVTVGSSVLKYLCEGHLMSQVQSALDADRLNTSKMNNYLLSTRQHIGNAKMLMAFSKHLGNHVVKTAGNEIQRKAGEKMIKDAKHMTKVFNVFLLPLDIVIMVDTCVKAANGSTHEASSQIRHIAANLLAERDSVLEQMSFNDILINALSLF